MFLRFAALVHKVEKKTSLLHYMILSKQFQDYYFFCSLLKWFIAIIITIIFIIDHHWFCFLIIFINYHHPSSSSSTIHHHHPICLFQLFFNFESKLRWFFDDFFYSSLTGPICMKLTSGFCFQRKLLFC